jgi:hypothetical protein
MPVADPHYETNIFVEGTLHLPEMYLQWNVNTVKNI